MKKKWKTLIASFALLFVISFAFVGGYCTGARYTYASAIQSELFVLWMNAALIRANNPERALEIDEASMFTVALGLYESKDLPFLSESGREAMTNLLTKVAAHLHEHTDKLEPRPPQQFTREELQTNFQARLPEESNISTHNAARLSEMSSELIAPLMNEWEKRAAKTRKILKTYLNKDVKQNKH
jgi:hypothetical protein